MNIFIMVVIFCYMLMNVIQINMMYGMPIVKEGNQTMPDILGSESPGSSSKSANIERNVSQTQANKDQRTTDLNPSETPVPNDDPQIEEVRRKKVMKNKIKKEKRRRKKAEIESSIDDASQLEPLHGTEKSSVDDVSFTEPYSQTIISQNDGDTSESKKNMNDTNKLTNDTTSDDSEKKVPIRTNDVPHTVSIAKQKNPGVSYIRGSDLSEFLRRYQEEYIKIVADRGSDEPKIESSEDFILHAHEKTEEEKSKAEKDENKKLLLQSFPETSQIDEVSKILHEPSSPIPAESVSNKETQISSEIKRDESLKMLDAGPFPIKEKDISILEKRGGEDQFFKHEFTISKESVKREQISEPELFLELASSGSPLPSVKQDKPVEETKSSKTDEDEKGESFARTVDILLEEFTKLPDDKEEISHNFSATGDGRVINEHDSIAVQSQENQIKTHNKSRSESENGEGKCAETSAKRITVKTFENDSKSTNKIHHDEKVKRQSAEDALFVEDIVSGNGRRDYSDTDPPPEPIIKEYGSEVIGDEFSDANPTNKIYSTQHSTTSEQGANKLERGIGEEASQVEFIRSSPKTISPIQSLNLSIPTSPVSDDDSFSLTTSPTYLNSVYEQIYLARALYSSQKSIDEAVQQIQDYKTERSKNLQPDSSSTFKVDSAEPFESENHTEAISIADKKLRQASTSSSRMNFGVNGEDCTTVAVSKSIHEEFPRINARRSKLTVDHVNNEIITGEARESARQTVLRILPSFHHRLLELVDQRVRDTLNTVFSSASHKNYDEHEPQPWNRDEEMKVQKHHTPEHGSFQPSSNNDEMENESSESFVEGQSVVSIEDDAPQLPDDDIKILPFYNLK